MSILALTFAAPLILFSLIVLPLIWWLLRLTPPRPRQEVFPPTRILAEVNKSEETPAQSPWWLTLLRLLMAALVIVALAEPIWNAQDSRISGEGPLLIIMDDGWTTGPDWEERQTTARNLLAQARENERPVALALTTLGGKVELATQRVEQVEARLKAATPQPLPVDLTGLAKRLDENTIAFTGIAWLSNGLDQKGAEQLLASLEKMAPQQLQYFTSQLQNLHVISKVTNTPEALSVALERADGQPASSGRVTAYDQKGRSISAVDYSFAADKQTITAQLVLPVELRNEIAKLSIDAQNQAGATQLLDERFRRRRVGLISGSNADQAQPLLSPLYFISRALNPFSEVRESRAANVAEAIPQLIEENVSTLVLADIGTLPGVASEQLEDWVEAGGMLVRFAGPRLAAATDDTLVPVELRRGGRSLGGTLTWGTPQPLASFDEDSPFNGLTVPPDVAVTRQVLAQPGIDLTEKTWASLTDGTPLVTASQRGEGWIVLFHVTANASWSNLPLSGAFVDMLRRIVAVSNGAIAADKTRSSTASAPDGSPTITADADQITLPPLRMVDGFGTLTAPGPTMQPLLLGGSTAPEVTIETPPGTYGTSDAFVALNLFEGPANLKQLPTDLLPADTIRSRFSTEEGTALKPWLLAAALLLLALDCLAVLWMAGALRRRVMPAAAAAVSLVVFALHPPPVQAQTSNFNFEDTLRTRLAYVQTGDDQLDRISKRGLIGLTNFISSRTSLEPAEPVGVDINTDELAFYPLLYWPVSTLGPPPDAKAMARVDAFMKKGGSVLFDTRDQLTGGFGNRRISAETQRLREILSSLDIPPLEPVPDNHVLTRAFYLLNVFPGRYLEGKLWVETSQEDEGESAERPTRQGDGVSSIMITSNDMAGAWAVEADGSPSLPVVPANPTQRIYAYRTGVNIVMYTLTGNYKSDQVHIPALLERLGQ